MWIPEIRIPNPSVWRSLWIHTVSVRRLVEKGKIRYIGISNMTIPKLEAVLPLMKIKPATCELELHVCFQQQELYDYLVAHNIQPVGYMPIGSPRRPERDICPEDVADLEVPEMQAIAKAHGVHPALIALKWAHQRGEISIPFSVHNYASNLKCVTEDPLTDEGNGNHRNSGKRQPSCKRPGISVAWCQGLA